MGRVLKRCINIIFLEKKEILPFKLRFYLLIISLVMNIDGVSCMHSLKVLVEETPIVVPLVAVVLMSTVIVWISSGCSTC